MNEPTTYPFTHYNINDLIRYFQSREISLRVIYPAKIHENACKAMDVIAREMGITILSGLNKKQRYRFCFGGQYRMDGNKIIIVRASLYLATIMTDFHCLNINNRIAFDAFCGKVLECCREEDQKKQNGRL